MSVLLTLHSRKNPFIVHCSALINFIEIQMLGFFEEKRHLPLHAATNVGFHLNCGIKLGGFATK
jgi:hypothetical protein